MQRGDAIVQTDLFDDLAVFELEHRRARKPHLAAGRCRQRSHEEIAECWTSVRAAAFPTADYIVALGDEIGSAPEIEVRKCVAKIGHERLDVRMALARRMHRILQETVRRGALDNAAEITGFPPHVPNPSA